MSLMLDEYGFDVKVSERKADKVFREEKKVKNAMSLDEDEPDPSTDYVAELARQQSSYGFNTLDDIPDDEDGITGDPIASLSESLAPLVGKDRLSDVLFLVGPDAKEIPGHRMFLSARSPVFELMLYPQYPGQEKEIKIAQGKRMEIKVPDVTPENFLIMIRCIYTGRADHIDATNLHELLYLAKKYSIDCLRAACAEFMRNGLTVDTVCFLYDSEVLTDKKENLALKFIEENTAGVLQSRGWLQLSEAQVLEIVQNPRLCINEVELWDAVVVWAKEECERRQLVSAYERNMRTVLTKILPYIRFPTMVAEEIAEQVVPTNIVDEKQVVEIYKYLALKHTGAVCEAPYTSEPRRGKSGFRFDPKKKGSGITLSEGNLMASYSNISAWRSVAGELELNKDGVTEVEFILKQYDTSHGLNVICGLIPADHKIWDTSDMVGYSGKPGWGLIVGARQICTPSRGYGGINFCPQDTFHQGDRVGLRYDGRKSTCEFFKNGKSLGTPFNDVRVPVRLAVSMVHTQKVMLNFKTNFKPK